ncbi:dienelactone hydrolase family protein [Segetibacter koreensis]|uniref:dienelactone hydrolase family protein n=1 Tax=Segetibacter koreensis TaxID=398037 RepID=UPI0003820B7F|nr:alpha/beta family hydrolase [Segetibacter koreensis]
MNKRFHGDVSIPAGKVTVKGELIIPANANAIVIFSHGSGSSRFSKRNQKVAEHLHENNFGTLLFDLLTEEEDRDYYNRFNIDLLAKRLIDATEWLKKMPAAKDCRIGYFGASTGAASALQAAAQKAEIDAVVSRGGRPDLAMEHLENVKAPTLLIVGGLDTEVIELNKQAFKKLQCLKDLVIVQGASHLFEEPGKLDKVAELATAWFRKYLQVI